MQTDAAQREQALIELREVVSNLRARVSQDQLGGSDLILGCRRVLSLWVNSGGSSLDDQVITFTGIESQSDHVLGGSQVRVGRAVDHVRFKPGSVAEHEEVEEIGRFFRESFVDAVSRLVSHLEYHEEALDALGDDHDPHTQPNIEVIHARFAVLAKKWAPPPRKPK